MDRALPAAPHRAHRAGRAASRIGVDPDAAAVLVLQGAAARLGPRVVGQEGVVQVLAVEAVAGRQSGAEVTAIQVVPVPNPKAARLQQAAASNLAMSSTGHPSQMGLDFQLFPHPPVSQLPFVRT